MDNQSQEPTSPSPQKQTHSTLIIFGVVLLILISGIIFFVANKPKEPKKEMMPKDTMMEEPTQATGRTIEEIYEANKAGILTPAPSYTDTAQGESFLVRREDGTLSISVLSILPEAPEGSHYTAWLISDTDPTMIISLGSMQQIGTTYKVGYASTDQMPGYNTIRVTLETTDDDIPETTVLEGIVE